MSAVALRLFLTRAGRQIGGLVVLAAVVIPIFVVIASVHAEHWLGAGSPDVYSRFIVPWAGRAWAAIILLALAGWAAGAVEGIVRLPDGADDRPLWRILRGVGVGLIAALACGLCAAPSWIWLARLGAGEGIGLIAALAVAPPLVGGVAAGGLGTISGGPPGALAGLAAGGALFWATWGAFG